MDSVVEWLITKYFGKKENCSPNFRYYIDEALKKEKEQMEKLKDFEFWKEWKNETFKSE
jgi:hypothetical protein